MSKAAFVFVRMFSFRAAFRLQQLPLAARRFGNLEACDYRPSETLQAKNETWIPTQCKVSFQNNPF